MVNMLPWLGVLGLMAVAVSAAASPTPVMVNVSASASQIDASDAEETPVKVNRVSSAGRLQDVQPVKRYDGHAVLKVVARTQADLDALKELLKDDKIDVWTSVTRTRNETHFRVPPSDLPRVLGFLDKHGLKHEVMIADLQSVIGNQTQTPDLRGVFQQAVPEAFGWTSYHRLDSMYAWMSSLVQRHPGVAKLVKGGVTTEGREILGVRIAQRPGLPVFMVEGGIHAREWIGPAVATYLLDQLLTSRDPRVAQLAGSFEWHIFPAVNPDGYEYSHTTDRLWRGSRRRSTLRCTGVDLNRNFPFFWGTSGISWDMCSQNYPGTKAASEVETRTRMAYMEPLLSRTKAFVSFHSYGQYLLFPWAFTTNRATDYDSLLTVASKGAQAFAAKHGTQLRVGSPGELLYDASGSSMDWVHGNGVPYAFTFELRDTGKFGFVLPGDQIVPAAEETMDGLVAMASTILG